MFVVIVFTIFLLCSGGFTRSQLVMFSLRLVQNMMMGGEKSSLSDI